MFDDTCSNDYIFANFLGRSEIMQSKSRINNNNRFTNSARNSRRIIFSKNKGRNY